MVKASNPRVGSDMEEHPETDIQNDSRVSAEDEDFDAAILDLQHEMEKKFMLVDRKEKHQQIQRLKDHIHHLDNRLAMAENVNTTSKPFTLPQRGAGCNGGKDVK